MNNADVSENKTSFMIKLIIKRWIIVKRYHSFFPIFIQKTVAGQHHSFHHGRLKNIPHSQNNRYK